MSEVPILIDVRFAPDGDVSAIDKKPAKISEQELFKGLSNKAGDVYQPLAGGRGLFRLSRAARCAEDRGAMEWHRT
jgi:hypothetical protein